MPTVPELQSIGLNGLACKVAKTKGFRGWARHLGLGIKQTCTSLGQSTESRIADELRAFGRDVQRQSSGAPYDLLVDGRVRVNVKSARWREYGACRGYFFGIGDTWRRCDVLALVGIGGPAPRTLWVPSSEARQQTITLTLKHRLNKFSGMGVLDPL